MSDSDHLIVQEKLSFVSFNCNGFSNGLSYLPMLLNSFDVIFLQEHWFSVSELGKLNFDGFITSVISGFDDSVLLQGRPFGGCAILYCQNLVSSIKQLQTCSRRFCAGSINACGCICLLINLYLPTDYHSADATERFKDILGEIAGFISSTAHHFVVVGGDWNIDVIKFI